MSSAEASATSAPETIVGGQTRPLKEGARLKVELEKDLHINALVQMLGKPHFQKSKVENGDIVFYSHDMPSGSTPHYGPLVIVMGVSFLQLLMAWVAYCYVKNNMIYDMRNPLLTTYELFIGTNTTIPHGLVQDLCGDWEDLEMTTANTGELNHITMPDGSIYKPNDDYSLFYNLKKPFRTFNYANLGYESRSVLDNVLYVIHEGVTINPFNGGAGYSLLFIMMQAMWLFAILVEVRALLHNGSLLIHFQDDEDLEESAEYCFAHGEDDPEKYRMARLPFRGRAVLFISVISRLLVICCLSFCGSFLIMYTTGKMDLILNGLALLFVLELDQLIFLATVSGHNQQFIEDIEAVGIEIPSKSLTGYALKVSRWLLPALPFVVIFAASVTLRMHQVRVFQTYFHMTGALCLFAGSTPGGQTDLLAPVTGLCDSLLGATCAGGVEPASTLKKHGPCVITDQRVGTIGTSFYYLDDPTLFEGRVDQDGKRQSWLSWGEGNPRLYDKAIWAHGPYQDIMRKNCLQMYQVSGRAENRLVDDDIVETMPGAPFYCQRDALWKALFGRFTEGRSAATDITMDNIDHVRPLSDPEVTAAVDDCASTPPVKAYPDFPGSLLGTEARVERYGAPHPLRHAEGKRRKKLGAAGMLTIERPRVKDDGGIAVDTKTAESSTAVHKDQKSVDVTSLGDASPQASK